MIVVANKSGQLANRLFLFAHLVAFAAEHNLAVTNPSFDEYCEHFGSMRRNLFCRFPIQNNLLLPTAKRRNWLFEMVALWTSRLSKYRRFLPKSMEIIDTDLNQICHMDQPDFQRAVATHRLLVIRGWRFRDLAAFEKHATTIRLYFEPTLAIKEKVAALIRTCRNEAEVVIGIHIRRGDYKDFMGGRYYFQSHQYAGLMRQMKDLFPHQRVIFLICSNEVLPAEEFDSLHFRFGNNHIGEDLYSFAECDYIIGPPSTYTMWASFYGQVPLYKIVDPNATLSLSAFHAADGNCDLPEDIETCSRWGQNESCAIPFQMLSGVGK